MADQVNVKAVEVLDQFSADLVRFAERTSDTLVSVEQEIHRALQHFQDHRVACEGRVTSCEDELEAARVDLDACQSSEGDEDDDVDCSDYEESVAHARAELARAERALSRATAAEIQVREAVNDFELQARGLTEVAEHRFGEARKLLARKREELARYLDASVAVSSLASGPTQINTDLQRGLTEAQAAAACVQAFEGIAERSWAAYSNEERHDLLQEAESRLAATQGRAPADIRIRVLHHRTGGFYRRESNEIVINELNVGDWRRTMTTLLHEGRHAFQHHAITHEDGPRAEAWRTNATFYNKHEYGFELYWNQLIEVDARAFAESTLKLVEEASVSADPV